MKRPAPTDPASAGAEVSNSAKASRSKAASKVAAPPTELRPEKATPRRTARTAADAQAAKTEKDSQPDMPSPNTAQTEPETSEVERDALPPPGPRPVLPQRAIAKAETFKPGDHVVYPTHGVGKVERIAAEEIAGQK
ncbi:CarD family transcriptional regulator, partial [Acidiphilium sp.]|uniref:CarD family transcriptional regulator n=1 Tax=Acidiphilium sp. TaxID=527 RepID=UPI002590A7DF